METPALAAPREAAQVAAGKAPREAARGGREGGGRKRRGRLRATLRRRRFLHCCAAPKDRSCR